MLFEHIKSANHPAGATSSDHAPPTATPTQSQQETPTDLEYTCAVLPAFYRRVLADVQRAIDPAAEDSDESDGDGHSVVTINSAAGTYAAAAAAPADALVPPSTNGDSVLTAAERARNTLSVARAAVKTLGYFLHHPTYCVHFPLGESVIKRQHLEPRVRHVEDDVPMEGTISQPPPAALDGMVVLIKVLSKVSDRALACLICWVLAEQCLLAPILSPYVDRCINAFTAAVERCQTNAVHAVTHAGAATAIASTSTSVTAATSSLLAEVLHALWKFARLCPSTLRERCRRNNTNDPNALRWLQVLIIQPYLNPTFYFEAKREGDVELKRIAMMIVDLCVGTNVAELNSSGVNASGTAFRLSGSEFLLREVSVSSTVFTFCTSMQQLLAENAWVKAVISAVALKEKALETQREAGRRAAGSEEKKSENPQTESGAVKSITQEQYESRVVALYEDAFALLNVYLQCLGKIAAQVSAQPRISATATPAGSHSPSLPPEGPSASAPTATPLVSSSPSPAAIINTFLSFYQPLFNHALPSVRAMVFEKVWKGVTRILNCECKTPLSPSALAVLPFTQRVLHPPPHLFSFQGGGGSRANEKALRLAMKPFVHQLGKERDPSVVGRILGVWMEVLMENFVTPAPPDSAPGSMQQRQQSSRGAPSPDFLPCKIHSPIHYAECVAPILDKLTGSKPLPFELPTGGGWDSNRRTKMYEGMLEGLEWVSPQTSASAMSGSHGTAESGGPEQHSTSMHTASTTSTTTFSSSNVIPSNPPPPPAMSWLKPLLLVMLSQPVTSPSRTSFLHSLSLLLSKSLIRIGGPSERRALLMVIERVVDAVAVTERVSLNANMEISVRAKTVESTPLLSSHSPSAAAAASSSSAINTKDEPLVSLVHAMYRGWLQSYDGVMHILKPATVQKTSPLYTPSSPSRPGSASSRKSTRGLVTSASPMFVRFAWPPAAQSSSRVIP